MTNTGLIKDAEQFKAFVAWLPELVHDEVYCVSLAARNKYLTASERELYSLSRTGMFALEYAITKQRLYAALDRCNALLQTRRTRTGMAYPEKALVCYMNVNPASFIHAMDIFETKFRKVQLETLRAGINGQAGSFTQWFTLPHKLMSSLQQSTGRRLLVDIDVDSKDPAVLAAVTKIVEEQRRATVVTHGGYHVLVDKSTLPKWLNLGGALKHLAQTHQVEICINANKMVPIPGTRQAGHLVRFET